MRAMSGVGKNRLGYLLDAAFDLHETGMALRRQRFRRDHPDAGEAEIDDMFRSWVADRPPDGPGRIIYP